jgi:hypothetical protein
LGAPDIEDAQAGHLFKMRNRGIGEGNVPHVQISQNRQRHQMRDSAVGNADAVSKGQESQAGNLACVNPASVIAVDPVFR